MMIFSLTLTIPYQNFTLVLYFGQQKSWCVATHKWAIIHLIKINLLDCNASHTLREVQIKACRLWMIELEHVIKNDNEYVKANIRL